MRSTSLPSLSMIICTTVLYTSACRIRLSDTTPAIAQELEMPSLQYLRVPIKASWLFQPLERALHGTTQQVFITWLVSHMWLCFHNNIRQTVLKMKLASGAHEFQTGQGDVWPVAQTIDCHWPCWLLKNLSYTCACISCIYCNWFQQWTHTLSADNQLNSCEGCTD